ncbi:nagb/rpia/CoA transferase-like protein [Phlebopus sp. FC_14]|nr:nagb/rpia/CoA transferase-like protein [Phlebopus sp. FC_14]
MFELVKALNDGALVLSQRTPNPISLDAGCQLFIAFVTLFPHQSDSFADLKRELVKQGQKYATEALTYREKIAELALGFIKDDSIVSISPHVTCLSSTHPLGKILTHSYSRVVMKTLLRAHQTKRISVYVTEARPRALGLRTYHELSAAGIPCTVVLDSAVSYVMDNVDFVLVGSEAVVESGGLINAVGSNQIAIIAKAANIPFYALAESYKFHRLFPLSQYDLPTHNPSILAFPLTTANENVSIEPSTNMTHEQIACNPDVDYTRPDLITLVFSDVSSLTPEGVSQYLVGMFAG